MKTFSVCLLYTSHQELRLQRLIQGHGGWRQSQGPSWLFSSKAMILPIPPWSWAHATQLSRSAWEKYLRPKGTAQLWTLVAGKVGCIPRPLLLPCRWLDCVSITSLNAGGKREKEELPWCLVSFLIRSLIPPWATTPWPYLTQITWIKNHHTRGGQGFSWGVSMERRQKHSSHNNGW